MLKDANKLGERSMLASPLQIDGTSLVVNFGHGGRFAVPPDGDFELTIRSGFDREIVKVTAQAGDVLRIQRAQSGTAARAWGLGSCVEIEPTAGNFCAAVMLCAGPQIELSPGQVCMSECVCLTLTADGRISNVEVAGC